MRKRTILILSVFILVTGVAAAHHHPEHFPLADYTEPDIVLQGENVFWQSVYWIWGYHDRLHWVFILLMLYTCYHFRFFYNRNIVKHPGKCSWEKDPGYDGENTLMKWHRVFWYGNILLIAVHATEVLEGIRTLFFTGHMEYTYIFWPLSFEQVVHNSIETFPLWKQLLGLGIELFYVAAVTLWLLSCHFFRSFTAWSCCGAKQCCGGKKGVDVPWILKLNQEHGLFMWLALLSSVLILLVGGHL